MNVPTLLLLFLAVTVLLLGGAIVAWYLYRGAERDLERQEFERELDDRERPT